MGQTLPSWPLHYQFQPLQQCRDKGVSTNKAVTSTLLFCCPNEPTRPGICAAAIWDIQSSKKTVSKPCSCLGYKQPPSLQSSRYLPVLLVQNLQGSVARQWPYQILVGPWGETTKGENLLWKTTSGNKAVLQPGHGNKRDFLWRILMKKMQDE